MNKQNKGHNQKLRRNTCVFAVLMMITQVAFSLLYSFTYSIKHVPLNISAAINNVGLAILVTAGFGLMISYLKRLIWSGLGFTLFITAFTLQMYPLVNQLWTKTNIHSNTIGFNQMSFQIYLANSSLPSDKLYGNSMGNAFKCALAVVVAFSSILGRAGPLQCYVVTIIGTIGFELNRQLIINISTDIFGSYYIFAFGGFMGLAVGFIMKLCREKVNNGSSTAQNKFYQASIFSLRFALLGTLIIFTLFPMLSYAVDNSRAFNTFYLYTGPTSLLLGMSSSVISTCCMSSLINGNIIARDIMHAPIAGGIVVGSASAFIAHPVYSMVAGFAGGAVQTLIQNLIEKTWSQKKSIVSSISWSLFGVQGLLGGVFATGYKRIIQTQCKNLTFGSDTINFAAQSQLIIAVISAGVGLGCGAIAGLLILLFSKHKSKDHFMDRAYWTYNDGISYVLARKKKVINIKSPQVHPPEKKPQEPIIDLVQKNSNQDLKGKNVIIEYSQIIPFDVSTPNFEMSFSEGQVEIRHTYL